ncbi:hypothetical protein COO91_04315 [Nostoc flagelliforme CCNUN1]|uniref:Uncharacterized protein n=1 Tax=Nostoc flagelliforme CCNUN1 TaxID=2038116 RepID=A0A2K8SSH5_9NOSO|nr:hypothetical protein COO91_04315 [Nostoc flagelliforme CCNUN1]
MSRQQEQKSSKEVEIYKADVLANFALLTINSGVIDAKTQKLNLAP